MATLKRTSSKTRPWEVRWRDPRTDARPRRRFTTRTEAERMLAEAIQIEGLSAAAPLDRQWTLRRLIDEEQSTSRRKESTVKTRRSYYAHIPEHLLDENVRHHSVETIEGILNQAANRLALSSVEKLRSIVHSVYEYGVQRNVIPRNPAVGARIAADCQPSARAKKVYDAEVDPNELPSPSEAKSIAAAIPPLFKVTVECLYLLGLRLGEAVALDVEDWNSERRILRVHRSGVATSSTKGHREFRDVLVFPFLAKRIDQHVRDYTKGTGPLFPGPQGGRLTPSGFRQRYFYPAVDAALGQASLDEQKRRRIRPHDLRHTAATIMIQNGVSDLEIAAQLGHVDASFTRRLYGGVWRREERSVDERMQEWMDSQDGSDVNEDGTTEGPADSPTGTGTDQDVA